MGQEERVVEHFVVAVAKDGDSQAELEFAYPNDDESSREFCESVTMFMFPHAFGQDWSQKRGLPPPPMHNLFALTDTSGEHLYGASLCFYEALLLASSDHPEEDNNGNPNSVSPTGVQYQAKAICLLSKRPFYTQLLRYLEQLFILGTRQSHVNSDLSPSSSVHGLRWCGVERTLCNLFHEVPVPYRGLAVQLSVFETEIVLERPLLTEFPFEMDAELMTYAFMMVEPKAMLQLYHHVLLEHRILVVCADSVLVTAIAEAIKCLVFPLTWLHVYIPNIPDSLDLSTLLEAPVPFIAGAHTRQLAHVEIPDNVVKLEFLGGKFVLGATTTGPGASEISLPQLPEASQRVATKLGTMRLPDLTAQKREFHEKLWERRIQLQKVCMSTSSSHLTSSTSSSSANAGSILAKPLFLTRPSALYRKVVKLYLEIMAALLQDYPSFVSNDGNQAAFDSDKFVERKPLSERAFYREFVHTALFQSFLAQHHDHMSGSLPHDDALKLQFVHRRLLNDDTRDFRGSFAITSASKTFVAHAPQLLALPAMTKRKKSFVLPTRLSISGLQSSVTITERKRSIALEPVNVSICFPELDVSAFGAPREVVFPKRANDAATSSLGTFLKKSSSHAAVARPSMPSKELGKEWMQQMMKSVTMPSGPFKGADLPAAFKRSRTIDRIGRAIPSPFYRSMTQKALEISKHHESILKRPAPPVAATSIWLVTTSACACKAQVAELTETLTRTLKHHEKNSSHASEAYCQLIDCLGACGHPSECKAVFEECLSGSHLVSLEAIASHKHFWKPFSSLVRCYITNGLVQRAFDVLVQVKVKEEQHLDSSLGALSFGAQVLTSESEVLVERIYTTFSCGNMGVFLAARDAGVGSGAEVIGLERPCGQDGDNNNGGDDARAKYKTAANGKNKTAASCVREGDVVETINGEVVIGYPLTRVVQCLKQAYRPMMITFVRGLTKIEGFVTNNSGSIESNGSVSTHFLRLMHNSDQRQVENESESTKFRPRRDLCDRFGLLPQRGIRITTLADCTSCGSRASLSEIQDGWSASDPNDYTSRCARCGHRYVPRLCVMLGVMTAFYQPPQDTKDGAAAQIRVEQLEYLSMLVIRKELANLAQKLPLTMLSMAELRELNPRIYWNIVVKLLSLACPLDFLDLPDMTKKSQARLVGGEKEEVAMSGAVKPEIDNDGLGDEKEHESESLKELQQSFERAVQEIRAKSGSRESWEAVAARVLAQLATVAQNQPEKDSAGAARDGADAQTNDFDEEAEERRSVRTASATESTTCGDEDEEELLGGSSPKKAVLSAQSKSKSALPRMAESSRLAPFQRKSRAGALSKLMQ